MEGLGGLGQRMSASPAITQRSPGMGPAPGWHGAAPPMGRPGMFSAFGGGRMPPAMGRAGAAAPGGPFHPGVNSGYTGLGGGLGQTGTAANFQTENHDYNPGIPQTPSPSSYTNPAVSSSPQYQAMLGGGAPMGGMGQQAWQNGGSPYHTTPTNTTQASPQGGNSSFMSQYQPGGAQYNAYQGQLQQFQQQNQTPQTVAQSLYNAGAGQQGIQAAMGQQQANQGAYNNTGGQQIQGGLGGGTPGWQPGQALPANPMAPLPMK